MHIGQFARHAGVGVETVRYYQRIGLLTTPERPARSFRSYGRSDLSRLRFIRRAQQLGFSLEDAAELLRLSSDHCADVQALALRKLTLVREKRADLARMEAALVEVVARCRSRASPEECPLIEALASGTDGPGNSRFICQLGPTAPDTAQQRSASLAAGPRTATGVNEAGSPE